MDKKAYLEAIGEAVDASDEVDFLKYLINCCENVLENPEIPQALIFHPMGLQLAKLRAEVTQRLETRFDVKYGKFAHNEHLFSHTKRGR